MFRSVLHVSIWKLKILAFSDVLAQGKSYEHGFVKKRDDHKHCVKSCAESSFNRFFVHCLFEFRSIFHAPSRKFKILANPNVLAHGKSYEHGFVKNATVINFTRSHASSRVSIGFTCTISKIQNTGHS
ncbi:hypothetical protein B296_00058282 [Ensete ventricosum]|uniref:Secreted protein n=1 Tax=Ensete ventricosum TaxID=4639 RepID=A0A426WVM7_ENSVE|nr:hypothetical protein B296_00058282 [Ensete ventricosum]